MTIFNVGGGGGDGSPTFKEMTTSFYEIKAGDWGSGITRIRQNMFYYDDFLTSIEIPNGFTSLDQNAFYYATNLERVVVPQTVTNVSQGAFYGCGKLTVVNLPDGLIYLNSEVFRGCTLLEDVTIPDTVTYISSFVFLNCQNLQNTTIPPNVTYIGNSAFSGCAKLTAVSIPSSVTSIASSAFSITGSKIETLTIDNNASLTIGAQAFRYIGRGTAEGVTITLTGSIPPTIQANTFGDSTIKKIIVPQGSLTTYQTATNWSAYASLMEEAA